MIKHQIPIIFSSSSGSGAVNKSSDGSSFEINLEQPIIIPNKAQYCYVVCQAAEIWNTSPNILTGVNDKLYLSDGSGSLTITIPQGLYDLNLLNNEINRQIIESGRVDDSIIIYGNQATQKTVIALKTIGTSIDFTQSDTFRDILGFNSGTVGPSVSTDEFFDSDNVAGFNTIDYFIIHCDLVSYGIRINNTYTQAVAQILITSDAGDQIKNRENNPPEIPAIELIGQRKHTIRCWLTDQDNNLINTAGEDYAFRLVIYYLI